MNPESRTGKAGEKIRGFESQNELLPVRIIFAVCRNGYSRHIVYSKSVKIGLLSDTHGEIPDRLFAFFEHTDEIWHAGDIGNMAVARSLAAFKPLRGISGNIDGPELRSLYPPSIRFTCEKMKVWMIHSAGYPGHYPAAIRKSLAEDPPGLLVCGHSHILRVVYDTNHCLLYLNPGAAGRFGFHAFRTALRFTVENAEVAGMEIWQAGK